MLTVATVVDPQPRPPQDDSVAVSVTLTLLPLFLLLVMMVVFFRYLKKTGSLRQRSLDHMAAMETKTDRVIELLEQMRDDAKSR